MSVLLRYSPVDMPVLPRYSPVDMSVIPRYSPVDMSVLPHNNRDKTDEESDCDDEQGPPILQKRAV
jgi:hypothetical protein